MQKFKERWEITQTWQLIFPFLGILGLLLSGYLIGRGLLKLIDMKLTNTLENIVATAITLIIAFVLLQITLLIFKPLAKKWKVNRRWELIAIFIVFAITGSTAARLSDPLLHSVGLTPENTNPWLYWPVRILIIFPVYQVLLIFIGWLFGQFRFFWNFEKRMLKRMGFARFIKE
ncbi:prolipoprotein diacylglyceryl transferase [Aquimarina sp. ERC-38]|uniref:DUF6787 family protein n=1 Tax=Aquimarina sp. ERC-38 TaxID=2949996 RepID=UPI0022483274|nr:DUF6787 family protein [Aquimarina sp. ERC-38]UZO79687.1 prolipoprotein diacylglyceryl transferase [Aquimarina sp. ERC-38]